MIVALGISLGLGARICVDLYEYLKHPPATQEKVAPQPAGKAKVAAKPQAK